MKTNKILTQKRNAGMSLLELTVVILVLLSLISILFIGARAWKKGSDRSGCVMNLRNIQQAVRGDMNMKNRYAGDTTLVAANIIGASGYITKAPTCPSDGDAYTIAAATTYPAEGSMYAVCANIATLTDHAPEDIVGW